MATWTDLQTQPRRRRKSPRKAGFGAHAASGKLSRANFQPSRMYCKSRTHRKRPPTHAKEGHGGKGTFVS